MPEPRPPPPTSCSPHSFCPPSHLSMVGHALFKKLIPIKFVALPATKVSCFGNVAQRRWAWYCHFFFFLNDNCPLSEESFLHVSLYLLVPTLRQCSRCTGTSRGEVGSRSSWAGRGEGTWSSDTGRQGQVRGQRAKPKTTCKYPSLHSKHHVFPWVLGWRTSFFTIS